MRPDGKGPKDPGEGSGKSLWPEGLRRAVQAGANALFLGEEGGRGGGRGDFRLPKEAISFLSQQFERGRKDMAQVASREVRRVMRSANLRGELRRALVGLKVRVHAEIVIEEDGTQVAFSEAPTVARGEKAASDETADALQGTALVHGSKADPTARTPTAMGSQGHDQAAQASRGGGEPDGAARSKPPMAPGVQGGRPLGTKGPARG